MSPPAPTTVLLVHGAFHGAWCWEYQIPALTALGYETATVSLPCTNGKVGTTQDDDRDSIREALKPLLAAGKRVVLLAHSYGGPIANAAIRGLPGIGEGCSSGDGGGILGLVVLCGYIFPGLMDQGAALRAAGMLAHIFDWDTPSEGFFMFKDPSIFTSPDCTAEVSAWAHRQLVPQSMTCNMGIVPEQAWQDEGYKGGLGYIRATEDAIVPVKDQDAMIEAAGGRSRWVVRTLEGSSHSPMMSRPSEVAAAVDEIVQEFEKAA